MKITNAMAFQLKGKRVKIMKEEEHGIGIQEISMSLSNVSAFPLVCQVFLHLPLYPTAENENHFHHLPHLFKLNKGSVYVVLCHFIIFQINIDLRYLQIHSTLDDRNMDVKHTINIVKVSIVC